VTYAIGNGMIASCKFCNIKFGTITNRGELKNVNEGRVNPKIICYLLYPDFPNLKTIIAIYPTVTVTSEPITDSANLSPAFSMGHMSLTTAGIITTTEIVMLVVFI
jgi:hypothetical protein